MTKQQTRQEAEGTARRAGTPPPGYPEGGARPDRLRLWCNSAELVWLLFLKIPVMKTNILDLRLSKSSS